MFNRPQLLIPSAALGAAVLAAALLARPGAAQVSQPVPSVGTGGLNQISVVGSGTVLATPDVAQVTIGADVTDPTLSAAIGDASTRMTAVIQSLNAAGVTNDNIHTVTFNVNPVYDNQNNQQVLRGYEVQNLVQVRVTNITNLGSLIDATVSAGATRVYAISFDSSDPASLKSQARDQAMQDAQTKAAQLAKDGGVTLGRVVQIIESDASGVTPQPQRLAVPQAAVAAAAPTTPIQSGQLSVSTSVQVVYAIQ